ncbi:MAG TPA: Crp/Fnr family transcriptional regulator [Woeseiaceae bacterium]|nr:Crp/Fnr family transcriptional regulator [Woeseiaceae bacterium]
MFEHVRLFDPRDLRDGHLFRVGDRCDAICLVGNGKIRVYASGSSGRGVLLYNVRAGEICPINMRMVLAGTVALAHADASADLVAVLLNRAGVRDLSDRFSAVHQFVQQSVADRFEEIILRISDITTRSVDHRLVDLLLEEFDNSQLPRPTVEMTNDDLALAIGTAREVVNRKLHDLERMGALKLGRGRIWLEDRAALQSLMKGKQPAGVGPRQGNVS